jgi:CBS domain-containing protein
MPTTTTVADVMTAEVAVIGADAPVAEAADRMAELGVSALPVVDRDRRLLGLLRDDDLIVSEARVHAPRFLNVLGATIPFPGEMRHLEEELRKVAGATVGDVMQRDPVVAGAHDTVEDVATMMHDEDVRHVPVVDNDGQVVGIVTRGDLVRFIARTT